MQPVDYTVLGYLLEDFSTGDNYDPHTLNPELDSNVFFDDDIQEPNLVRIGLNLTFSDKDDPDNFFKIVVLVRLDIPSNKAIKVDWHWWDFKDNETLFDNFYDICRNTVKYETRLDIEGGFDVEDFRNDVYNSYL
ncbi:hypothetical protein [Secundilactobacillus similis]|uniref:Uncharacterized protein n=1 Tax=Secundilactobacillus similis DSM 23365 = JCM 2765 TaxID=1423804 RepID=A0A0R2EWL7_9LACO|nr:hypothetical protein [Secundilactobacillus similis]KRN18261.1 hypothetical protein FD14_GL002126 [Secundilactobacillus similis DSM 23365 = JCM 2765]